MSLFYMTTVGLNTLGIMEVSTTTQPWTAINCYLRTYKSERNFSMFLIITRTALLVLTVSLPACLLALVSRNHGKNRKGSETLLSLFNLHVNAGEREGQIPYTSLWAVLSYPNTLPTLEIHRGNMPSTIPAACAGLEFKLFRVRCPTKSFTW